MNETSSPKPSTTEREIPDAERAPSVATAPPVRTPVWRRLLSARTLIHGLFWSWHAIWVLGVVFGVAPELLPDLLVDSFQGRVPWGITGSAIALCAMPALTLLAGWHLRHDHWRLFRLFYGVGGVTFALLLVRLFFIREATAPVQLLLGTLAAGAAFYLAELFGGLRRLGRAAAVVRMVGYSALLIIGLYVGVAMGLYAIPVAVLAIPEFFEALFELLTRADLLRLLVRAPFIAIFGVFVVYSCTLLMGLPLAVAALYTRGYRRGLNAFAAEHSKVRGLAITAATIGGWLLAFGALNQQPQAEAFERLSAPPADRAAEEDNLAQAESIREGLLNAYLAPYRYWGARGRNIQLARMYRRAFGADEDVMAPQHWWNAMAAPLLYDGDSMAVDRMIAEVRYEQFFDQPLQAAERDTVLAAISATYDRSTAEAGLLDVGQRKVLLTEQSIDIETHGDLARFTLHEVYVNQTWEQQEVFYYFNLPEHAAITGLWLGDDDDLDRRFPYVVSPRGAAQQVYRQQRARRVDPALLEQVGPRQYRLRAFPIPAKDRRDDGEASPLHLWMEWTVLADDTGWPAPQLAEARNVYWDTDDTPRTIDGRPSAHDGWLPFHFTASPTVGQTHQIDVGGYRVRAEPVEAAKRSLGVHGRLAVVLDTSLSMRDHADEVRTMLTRLSDNAQVDLVLASSPFGAQTPRLISLDAVSVNDLDLQYYGGHTLVGALAQFDALRERGGQHDYAAVIVLSDQGSFAFLQDDALPRPMGRLGADIVEQQKRYQQQLAADATTVAEADLSAPVWLLHLGGLPHAYRDEVGDLLQRSRGGVATDLDELAARLGRESMDGYRWTIEPLASASAGSYDEQITERDPFAAIAARVLVSHLATQVDTPTPEQLDQIHAIAVAHSVVTSWSSMIVLVNDAQREALRRAEQAEDRFDREAESGTEATTTPNGSLELAATPEPEEWLLLALVLLALIWRMRSMSPAVRWRLGFGRG